MTSIRKQLYQSAYPSEKSGNENVCSNSAIRMWGGNDEFEIYRDREPVPVEGDGYFFEVNINHPQNGQCNTHIGLTTKHLDCPTKTIEKWSKETFSGFKNIPHSYGYSSSGTIYGEKNQDNFSANQSYSWGDTIGCHVDNLNKICCFTKNGVYLNKIIHLTDIEGPLYPTIAFASSENIIKTSFLEKKFEFDMQGMKYH